jgi:hypothetical protein
MIENLEAIIISELENFGPKIIDPYNNEFIDNPEDLYGLSQMTRGNLIFNLINRINYSSEYNEIANNLKILFSNFEQRRSWLKNIKNVEYL